MKSTVNKILLLGAALFCASQTVEATNSPLTFPDGVSAMRVSSERALSNAPATEPVCAGAFAENNSRFFDLLCTGRCDLFDRVLNLTMTPADKVPSFVKVGSVTGEGNAMKDAVVYAEPTPMGTIEVPAGRNGWVKVELKDQLGAFGGYKDHILLQLRKQGDEENIRYLYKATESEHTVEYIEAEEGDIVELVPILSATAIDTDGAHTPVTPNDEVDLTAFGGGTSLQEFNFTSVYRVDVDFVQRDISGVARWTDVLNKERIDTMGTPWQYGVGPKEQNKSEVIFAWEKGDGHTSYSTDGINWERFGLEIHGDVLAYGGGRWCTVSTSSGSQTWIPGDDSSQAITTPTGFTASELAYGNGIFMAIGANGVYTLKENSDIWQGPIAGSPTPNSTGFLCYGSDRWITVWCEDSKFYAYFSIDNGNNWKIMNNNLHEVLPNLEINWGKPVCCYAKGYFYMTRKSSGSLISLLWSSDGNRWNVKEIDYKDNGIDTEGIVEYQNRLYLFGLGTTDTPYCAVGLFDPADEGPEAATTNP